MSTRSKSPSRRQSKKKQKRLEQFGEDDEMSHNRLNGRHASDYDYFREIEPKLNDLKIAQEAVQSENEKVEEALRKIIGCLKEHGDAVSVVGENLEREQDRVKEIEELKIAIRQIRHLNEEELTDREKQLEELKEAAMVGQRKEEELQERESQLELEYKEKVETLRITEEAKHEEWKRTSQKELEQGVQQRVGEYSSKAERLEQQTKKLEKERIRLREENQILVNKLEEKELALEGLKARNGVLNTRLEEGRDEFIEGEKTVQFYQQSFATIETNLRGFVSARFAELPDQTLHKFQSVSETLINNAQIFANTPYSNTFCSVLLRSAKAQNVILEVICSSIWQPLYSGALRDRNTQQLLNDIYSTLTHRGPRSQSIWRLLSVESMDTLTNGRNPNMTSLVDNVLEKLDPLVRQEWKVTMKEELESLFEDAAKLWSIVQKDRNLIEIDCEPNPDDQNGWVEDGISKNYVPELETVPEAIDSIQVLTFPKVLRYAYCRDPTAAQKNKGPYSASVLHKGTAIFPNSAILREATKEREDQEQDIRAAIYRSTTKTRSPSITLQQDPTLLREKIRKGKANRELLHNGTKSGFV